MDRDVESDESEELEKAQRTKKQTKRGEGFNRPEARTQGETLRRKHAPEQAPASEGLVAAELLVAALPKLQSLTETLAKVGAELADIRKAAAQAAKEIAEKRSPA